MSNGASKKRIWIGIFLGVLLGLGGVLGFQRFFGKGMPEAEFRIRLGNGATYQKYLHIRQDPREVLKEIREVWSPVLADVVDHPAASTNRVECTVYRSDKKKVWGADLPVFRVHGEGEDSERVLVLEIRVASNRSWTELTRVPADEAIRGEGLLPLYERIRSEIQKAWDGMAPADN